MALYNDYPKFMIALCLWREARSHAKNREILRSVVHVILNRARANRRNGWPTNVPEVIMQPWQFTSFMKSDPNVDKFPVPKYKADWLAFEQCCAAADDPGEDPTDGAVFYHTLPESTTFPNWADPAKLTKKIGPFRFYRL